MNFPVLIAFALMVLAPCLVAVWGRMRAETDDEVDEMQDGDSDASVHAAVAGLEPLRAWPGELQGQAVETIQSVAPVASSAKAELVREVVARRQQERAIEPVAAVMAEEALFDEPALVAPTLEELLEVAVGEARQARAAAMRADAAASDVAARVAAAKVEAAAEASRMARREAEEAAEASLVAQDAYEALLLREARAEEVQRELERPRRAA